MNLKKVANDSNLVWYFIFRGSKYERSAFDAKILWKIYAKYAITQTKKHSVNILFLMRKNELNSVDVMSDCNCELRRTATNWNDFRQQKPELIQLNNERSIWYVI